MALIICPDCGKQFSDRASCCPQCGCPTEEALKSARSPEETARLEAEAAKQAEKEAKENAEAAAKLSAEAANKMQAAVKAARAKADVADSAFDRKNDRIQMKASRSLNLYGNAVSQAADIAADCREACDELYTTYQYLIGDVDRTCRPLLAMNPEGSAIRQVRDLIKYLNSESEIGNNFTASLNGSSLGDVASVKYVPSMENKMIQRFWEDAYAKSPYAPGEAERRKKAAEEEGKRREEQKKKQEEERKKEEERRKTEGNRLKQQYQNIEKECGQKKENCQKALQTALTDRINALDLEIEAYLRQLNAQLTEMESNKKLRRSPEFKVLRARIEGLTEGKAVSNEKERLKKRTDAAAAEYAKKLDEYLKSCFPNKGKGKDDYDRYRPSSDFGKKTCPDAPAAREVLQ